MLAEAGRAVRRSRGSGQGDHDARGLLALGDDERVGAFAELLKQEDRLDRLRELTDEGYFDAACALAQALEEKGDVGGALEVLHEFAGLGNPEVDWVLADLLARRGDLDAAIRYAEVAATYKITSDLVKALVEDGRVDRALDYLRSKVKAGGGGLSSLLNSLLREHGRDRELRARISAGDQWAWLPLHELLVEQGRTAEAKRLREFGLTSDGEVATG